jgi:hypothetical protein
MEVSKFRSMYLLAYLLIVWIHPWRAISASGYVFRHLFRTAYCCRVAMLSLRVFLFYSFSYAFVAAEDCCISSWMLRSYATVLAVVVDMPEVIVTKSSQVPCHHNPPSRSAPRRRQRTSTPARRQPIQATHRDPSMNGFSLVGPHRRKLTHTVPHQYSGQFYHDIVHLTLPRAPRVRYRPAQRNKLHRNSGFPQKQSSYAYTKDSQGYSRAWSTTPLREFLR